jgi:hypothetical protein
MKSAPSIFNKHGPGYRISALTIIAGPPATGKSMYAQALVERLRSRGDCCIVIDSIRIEDYTYQIKQAASEAPLGKIHVIYVTPVSRIPRFLEKLADVIVRTSRPAALRSSRKPARTRKPSRK